MIAVRDVRASARWYRELWIFTDRLDAIRERAGAMRAKIMKEPWQNPLAGWREFTLMDPDGYRIAVAQF